LNTWKGSCYLKLTTKVPLIVLITFTLAGTLSGLALILLQVKANSEHYTKIGDALVSILVNQIEQDMVHSSPQVLKQSINELDGLAGIVEIVLYNASGKAVASGYSQDISQKTTPPDVLEAIKDGHIRRSTLGEKGQREFDTIYPLSNKTECMRCHRDGQAVLGVLKIGIDAEPYYKAIGQQVNLVLLTGILTVGTLMVIFVIVSRRLLLNRLKRLEFGARRVASGDYSFRVIDTRQDEVGAVSGAFNEMAGKVHDYIALLKETVRIRTEERSTLDSIIASMGEGLVVVDNQKNLAYCNSAAEQLLGLEAAAFLGKPVAAFNRGLSTRVVEPKDWETVLTAKFKEINTQPKLNFVVMVPERREIEAILFVVGKGDQYLGTGALLRDVTKEREIDRMKTQFISIASHELRTPLTIVYGFSELLLTSRALPQPDKEWVERIYKESQRLNNIVEDLLSLSRIEAGGQALNLEALSLQPVTTQIIARFSTIYPSHNFNMVIPDDLPRLWADPDRLIQVLTNLVDNAAKYSPKEGAVTISARRADGNGGVEIAVADKGFGIPPEEMPKLFTRFHRIHRPESDGIRGTGLGLSIVKSLVEMMSGSVRVESVVNRGSTFYVSLPMAKDGTGEKT